MDDQPERNLSLSNQKDGYGNEYPLGEYQEDVSINRDSLMLGNGDVTGTRTNVQDAETCFQKPESAQLDESRLNKLSSYDGHKETVSTENSSKYSAHPEGSSQQDICNDTDKNLDSMPTSKILKGILESSVINYTSDTSNEHHSSQHLENETLLESDTNKIVHKPHKPNQDSDNTEEGKQSIAEEEFNNTEPKEINDRNREDEARLNKISDDDDTAVMVTPQSDREHENENSKMTLPSTSKSFSDTGAQESTTETNTPSKNVTQLNVHSTNQNGETQPVSDKPQSGDKPVKYRCSKCPCVTKDKRLFDNHSCDRELGSEEDKVKITIELNKEKNSYVCKECNFSSSGHGFEEHLMCHLMLRPYQCLYCKECFINRREISRHVIKSHNGAKMSCALRALRRAKGLIKDVAASGTLSFMARVAGKVPLEKDPEKKKNSSAPLNTEESVVKNSTTEKQRKDEDKEDSIEKRKDKEEKEAMATNEENDPQDDTSKSDSAVSFSKLREVLTAENPSQLVEEKESEESSTNEKEEKKELKVAGEQGLKIIASYSLHEEASPSQETPHADETNDANHSHPSHQPNFFVSSPPSTPEPELVSFLGPEHPGFKQSESQSPLLCPPPLSKPAPVNSNTSTNMTASSFDSSHRPSIPTKPEKISSFFICGFNCTFNSISQSEFLEHLTHFHSTESSFPCYYCWHKSSRIEDMVSHTASHADSSIDKKVPLFNCSLSGCQFGSNMISDFIKHVSTAHKDGNKPACNACVSVFPEVSMLQTHLEENIIHVVNCPHCPCKASERRAILNHISSEHPGKPKMVSVFKQLICRDRKMNGYERVVKEMLPPSLTPACNSGQGTSVLDQILRRHDPRSTYSLSQHSSSIVDALTGCANTSPSSTPSPALHGLSPFSSQKFDHTPENERSPTSETSGFSGVRVKEEIEEFGIEGPKEAESSLENNSSYIIDENGIRRRLYVPMSERHAENFRCKFCTFVARDLKRLACHERSHGMPPTKKDRFKCMFCPQGFDSELKFRLHITCHPGLIKFLLYKCKKCEFDSNQKHTIVKHITCNRDRKHRGIGPVEDQYTIISRSLESRVLECEQCDYMTRHKVHMAIHYQREHGILRDKNDFVIEGLTPSDTPVTSTELNNFGSTPPQDEDNSHTELARTFPASKKRKDSVSSEGTNLSMGEIYERNELFTRLVSQQAALQPGHVLENQARKFKCPICKYLLPKAADLKNHVKRHSEIGQITLVMFRCKYCSCMSTARELLYDHLREKHPGKSIALVKKIVAIDTTETDKSFAETSVEESLQQLEASVHNEIMSAINNNTQSNPPPAANQPKPSTSLEQLFVIPQGGETFQHALQCPKCSYNSHLREEIIQHVSEEHPEVKIIRSDQDVDDLAKSTTKDLNRSRFVKGSTFSTADCQEEVLIVPDEPIFKEMALCSRCNFSTMLRKDMVLHLQQNHPEISVMGRNSYPVQVSTMGSKLGENVLEESCVVGSGSLDAKLRSLYENFGSQMKCLICGIERPKKFFIHVHILRHLNIYLWKCAFCSHRGLQKYKMVDHIKKIHPGHPMSVRYLRVNVESRVAQFMSQFSAIQSHPSTPNDNDSSEEFADQTNSDSKQFLQKSSGGSSHALGSDDLDEKLRCLYDFSDGLFYKCLACTNQFQRKFAIHRHIIISHLKVALLSCTYCGMQGVEKHQMVDHVIACHPSQPVDFHTNDVDIVQAVANFLAKSSTKEYLGLDEDSSQSGLGNIFRDFPSTPGSEDAAASAEDYYNHVFPSAKSNFLNLGTNYKFNVGQKRTSVLMKKKKTTGNKNKTIVDPGVIMLGREALDKELCSLYQARGAGQLRCLICRWEFPRKYPLHRHIMLKHLRMNLVACPYCDFDGVEKYTVSTHIKEEHRDQPINIRYIQPDVRSRVRQFLDDMASGSSKIKKRMSSSSSSPSLSMLVKMKREKNSSIYNEADTSEREEEEEEEENGEEQEKAAESSRNQGLVVAMFGKKSKKVDESDDIVVKREIEDEEYEDNNTSNNTKLSEYSTHDEEGEEDKDNYSSFFDKEDIKADEDDDEDDDGEEDDDEETKKDVDYNFMSNKFKSMESYAPGSYRSPTGGKPKALDVITKIKVLKSKEGPITKFYCEKCKFTSVHRSNIVRHIYKIHERYQTHTCPICHYQTLSLILMQTHMKKKHPGVDYKEDSFSFQPPRTKPRSHSLFSLSNSQQRKRKYERKTILSTPSVPTPSTSSGPKQYACAYCHYETNTQEDILEHTKVKHSQRFSNASDSPQSNKRQEDKSKACWERSKKAVKRKLSDGPESTFAPPKRKFIFEKGDELIQCGHCDVRETSLGRIQHHMECDHAGLPMQYKHIPAWRFVCKTCAVKTMATSKMKYHLNRHVSYRPYTCVNCGAFFPSPDQCRRHARANRHEEQYMYVRNAKKEQRVEELLQETRSLALKIQDEAFNDPSFDITNIDSFLSKYQDTKHNLKRTGSSASSKVAAKKLKMEEKGAAPVRKQVGKSPQTVGIEMNVTIKCYSCDFQANTVYDVSVHHKKEHPGEPFYWTELDRGFTCDRTGEALPNTDSIPSQSGDVGYSTKISLSAGSNSSRFKCKSCDFSSAVIQAMKSHLKSHQPKGYICPYCSRFFSGKEKLMRHQYCLHKGLSIWVIHLRKSSSANTSATKNVTTVSLGNDDARQPTAGCSPIGEDLAGEREEEEEGSTIETVSAKTDCAQLRFVCNDCSFTSDSLLQYRQHLSKAHATFRQSIKDNQSTMSNDEEDKLSQSSFDREASFQCGHCKFQSSESVEMDQHHKEAHSAEEPCTVELKCDDDEEEEIEDVNNPLLNLEPRVSVKRIPSSTIAWYDDAGSETSENELEDSFEDKATEVSTLENHMDTGFERKSLNDKPDRIIKSENITKGEHDNIGVAHSKKEDDDEEEHSFVEEGVSQIDDMIEDGEEENEDGQINYDDGSSENNDLSKYSDDEEEERTEEEHNGEREEEDMIASEEEYEEELDTEMQEASVNASDEFTRDLGLTDGRSSPPAISETDMMIMEFNGMQRNERLPNTQGEEGNEIEVSKVQPNNGDDVEEECEEAKKHNNDDDDDDEFDESNVTLASPLPMISLGDGVTVSPDMFSKSEAELEENQDSSTHFYTEKEDYDSKSLFNF